MAREVTLKVRATTEGESRIAALASQVEKLEKKFDDLGGAQKRTSAATKEHQSFLDRLWNRILQGIPTMFSLVAAYKALQLVIRTTKEAIADLDEELKIQQSLAGQISVFSQWRTAAGKVIEGAEGMGLSMRLAGQQMEYLKSRAGETSLFWEDIAKGAADAQGALMARGVSAKAVNELVINFAKLAGSAEEFQKRMANLAAFARNPRNTAEIAVIMGLGRDQVRELQKNKDDIGKIVESLLKFTTQKLGDYKPQRTFEVMFKDIKESVIDGLQSGFDIGFTGAVKGVTGRLNELKLLIADFAAQASAIIGSLGQAGAFQLLVMIVARVNTEFSQVIATVYALASGFYLLAQSAVATARVLLLIATFGKETSWSLALKKQAADLGAMAEGMNVSANKVRDATADFNRSMEAFAAGKKLDPSEMSDAQRDRAIAEYRRQRAAARGPGGTIDGNVNVPGVHTPPAGGTGMDKLRQQAKALLDQLKALAADNSLSAQLLRIDQMKEKLLGLFQKGAMGAKEYAGGLADAAAAQQKLFDRVAATTEQILFNLESIGDAIDAELNKDLKTEYEQQVDALIKASRAKEQQLTAQEKEIANNNIGQDQQRELNALAATRLKLTEATAAALARMAAEEQARQELYAGSASSYISFNIDDAVAKGLPVMARLREIADYALQYSQRVDEGLHLAVASFIGSVKTRAQAVFDVVKSVTESLRTGLRAGLSAIFLGDTDAFEQALKGILTSLANTLAEYVADTIEQGVADSLTGDGGMKGLLRRWFGGGETGGATTTGNPAVDAFSQSVTSATPNVTTFGSALALATASLDTFATSLLTKSAEGNLPPIPQGRTYADYVRSQGRGTEMTWEETVGVGAKAPGKGFNLGAAITAAVGAAGLYQQARRGGLTPLGGALQGGLSGAAVGLQIGGNAGWIGAIVGVVVGFVAGLFSGAQESKSRKTVMFAVQNGVASVAGDISAQELAALRQKAQAVINRISESWIDIMLVLPREVFDRVMQSGVFDATPTLGGFPNEKGDSPENFQGRYIHSQNWSKFVDLFIGEELPAAMFASFEPALHEILGGLGFSAARANELVEQWRAMGDNVYEEIRKMVAAVSTLRIIFDESWDSTFDEDLADAQENARKTFADIQRESIPQLQQLVDLLGQTTGPARVAVLERIAAATDDLYQKHLDFVASLADAIAQVAQSIEEQIFGITLDQTMDDEGKPTQATVDALFERLNFIDTQLRSATSPEEVTRLTGVMQGIIGQIYQLDPQAYAAWAQDQLTSLLQYSTDRLKELGDAERQAWDDIMSIVKGALDEFATALENAANVIDDDDDGDGEGGVDRPDRPRILPTEEVDQFAGSMSAATPIIGDFGAAVDAAAARLSAFADRVSGGVSANALSSGGDVDVAVTVHVEGPGASQVTDTKAAYKRYARRGRNARDTGIL